MLRNSPTALRVLKSALNAAEDGQAGIQQLGGDATLLFYQSEEGNEVGSRAAEAGQGCNAWKCSAASRGGVSQAGKASHQSRSCRLAAGVEEGSTGRAPCAPSPAPACAAPRRRGLQGRQAYLDKRPPNFSRFKRLP